MMYWVIQENLHREPKFDELIQNLVNGNIPHSLHKVIPFIGELEPDVFPKNPVICMGSYSMRHVAAKKGWNPGVFDLKQFPHNTCEYRWKNLMLNAGAMYYKFGEIPRAWFHGNPASIFIRPNEDSKYFPGQLMTYEEINEWQHKIRDLGEDDGTGLRADTMVFLARPKMIQQEVRCWILDKRVITSSVYKIGGRVTYTPNLDDDVIKFAQKAARKWSPVRCFVMDIARTEEGLKIIEINTMNAAGLYAADVGKLVSALEEAFV